MTMLKALLLLTSFGIIYFLHNYEHHHQEDNMKCEADHPVSESEAVTDWNDYYVSHKDHLTGSLNCFCNGESDKNGFFSTIFKVYTTSKGESKICLDEYLHDLSSMALGWSISLFIVIADEILASLVDKMLDWIGFHSQSELAEKKKNIVFIVTFFNAAILLLLINADFTGTGIPLLGMVFHGLF